MTREPRPEIFEENPYLADFQSGWAKHLDDDIAAAVDHAAPVLITAPMPCAAAIVQAIVSRDGTPEILSYEAGVGDVSDAMAEGRRAAARNGRAILWLKEIHRLEADAQRSLIEKMSGEVTEEERLQIIASSTADLFQYVNAGAFDARLFYRLNTIHIMVPKGAKQG
jgi:Sigma-54 interaction domain